MHKKLFPIVLLLACSTAPQTAPPQQPTAYTGKVEVYRFSGQFVGSLEPGGQSVTVWVRGTEAGYTEDRKPILAVKFTASRENDAARVAVFALANEDNATKEEDLRPVEVATYRVGPGQSVPVEGLSRFGMPPMLLRGTVATAAK